MISWFLSITFYIKMPFIYCNYSIFRNILGHKKAIKNVLVTNVLVTKVLVTNVLVTNVLVTNVLLTKVLVTNVLVTAS